MDSIISKTISRSGEEACRAALLPAVLVSAGYYVTSRIGFAFTLQPGSVSLLWLPNSLLLAGLLLVPTRAWWVVILAAFPAHVASEWQSGVPTGMVLSWFVSNSMQALLGAVGIRCLVKDDLQFNRTRDVTVFLVFGVFLAPFLASFIDSGLVVLNGLGRGTYWSLWRIRFFSNVLASLMVVPPILVWSRTAAQRFLSAKPVRYMEGAVLMASLLVVGFLVFDVERDAQSMAPVIYWSFPFLLWATARFGVRGITAALVIMGCLAISGVKAGAGPFVTSSVEENALAVQMFLIALSVPLLVLAAALEERKRTEQAARNNEDRLMLALHAARMNTWEWHIRERRFLWSEGAGRRFGGTEARHSVEKTVHPEDLDALRSAMDRAVIDRVPSEAEFRVVDNGNTQWFLIKGKVLQDGNTERVQGIGLDITHRKLAEQALYAANSRTQAILRALPDMMFLQEDDGTYVDYYARDPSELLVPPATFIGRKVIDIFPAEVAARIMDNFARISGDDAPRVIEYDLQMGTEKRYYEARLVRTHTNHVLSIVRDITDQRRAEQAVRVSQEKLLQSNREIRDLAARLIRAQESERQRISLLLHDDVNQSMAAMGLEISRLKRKLGESNTEVRSGLEELGQLVHSLTAEIRDLSHHLHPRILEHLGLVAALKHLTEPGDDKQIATTFTARVGKDPIQPDVAVCLYRVALEALQNVSRHSGAATAAMELREENGFLTLEVSDSGRGFDVEKATRGTGIGLASLEERVRLLQGSLEVRSANSGTVLVARIPRSGSC
jgi:PAS domain S-box-containing protein